MSVVVAVIIVRGRVVRVVLAAGVLAYVIALLSLLLLVAAAHTILTLLLAQVAVAVLQCAHSPLQRLGNVLPVTALLQHGQHAAIILVRPAGALFLCAAVRAGVIVAVRGCCEWRQGRAAALGE